jgi:NAD(P)-dependent dehydrogenase (short-subunit alcohol dehydrogenase family)
MTKMANILFTYELAERLEGTGVMANCLHPGAVSTNFAQNNRGPIALLFRLFKPFMRSPEQGADTLVYLASSPEAGELNGKYLTDRKEVSPAEPRDETSQKRLWEISEELTNLKVAS